MRFLHRTAAAALACAGLLVAAPAFATQRDSGAPAAPHQAAGLADSAGAGILLADDRRDRARRHDRDRYDRQYRHRDREPERWEYDHRQHWRGDRHPRRDYWRGRPLPPHGRFLVIPDYWTYRLPPPPRGHYYVRVDNDVFLVMEATRTIIDAFILLELMGR